MRIAVAQINYIVGDLRGNAKKIADALRRGKEDGVDVVICAEMALTGYPAKDLWLAPDFMDQTEEVLEELAAQCQGIACLVGAPQRNQQGVGKPLYNAAVLLEAGRVQVAAHKGLVPDYDVFDEYRYFEPGTAFTCLEFQGHKLAVTVCEDLWNTGSAPLYGRDPMASLRQQAPDLLVNMAASPFSVGHAEARQQVMKAQVEQAGVPLIYVNQVGAHTDLIFDGRSMVWQGWGQFYDELPAFEEAWRSYDLIDGIVHAVDPEIPPAPLSEVSDIALVHQALIMGMRDYFKKSGFKKALLGLSGGLDSAVVAALACEALGPDQVLCVLMPSAYSSDHSIKDAQDLVDNTGCASLIVPIAEPVQAFESVLEEAFEGRPADTTEENIQARSRGLILMALSNKLGHVLLNTSNKSEAAVGYGTLYGDMAGAISVIGDVFKTDVYRLAEYINREREIIPINTIRKPPSAELRPDQKDSDSLPEYAYLDAVLRAYIEENQCIESIKVTYGDGDAVDRIIALVDRAEFKRYQAPPTLRVSKKAFGSGRSMPLVMRRSSFD